MIMGLVTLSDANIRRIVDDAPLIWQVVAPDDSEPYEEARAELVGLNGKAKHPPDLDFGEHERSDADLDCCASC